MVFFWHRLLPAIIVAAIVSGCGGGGGASQVAPPQPSLVYDQGSASRTLEGDEVYGPAAHLANVFHCLEGVESNFFCDMTIVTARNFPAIGVHSNQLAT
ncbi:MAG: hypothetical protein OXC81_00700, partial [Betaproteobacteria bacterium]|nr:hypothetical protein [Betaproteobacteria bacterium]